MAESVFEGEIQLIPSEDGNWYEIVVELPDGSYRHVGYVDSDWDTEQIEDYVDEWWDNEYA